MTTKRKRHTTRVEDAKFLLDRFADLRRDWQVGDAAYKTCNPPTTIVRFDGETVHLADGTSMHRSQRTPKRQKGGA
jgi:hypothetical protein